MPRKKRLPPPDWAIMRDPTPVQLQDLLNQLGAHIGVLPPTLSKKLSGLIGWALVQVQDYQLWTPARIRHQRVAAVGDAIKRGLKPEKAYADAAIALAGTPGACGPGMMKKTYLAEQKARRRRAR